MSTDASSPLISVIIPVYNETATVNDCIAYLRSLDGSEMCEIIVVDGNPEANTLNGVIHEGVIKVASPPGRGIQMNAGAARAEGEVLLFLHADTRLPPKGLGLIRLVMAEGDYGAGAFRLGIDSPGLPFRIIEYGAMLRTMATRVPYGDQAIFMKKDFFNEIGGYRDIPIMEDVELMTRIRKGGAKVLLLPDKVRTSARRWEKEGLLCRTLRNWMILSLYLLKVSPEKLQRFYGRN